MKLARDEVHIWQVPLNPAPEQLTAACAILDRGERERASAFVTASDRSRFVAAHVALRMILACYSGTEPANVALTQGLYGKPALVAGSDWLRFNLAHSGDLALIACSCDREVGIDIEHIRPDSADESIAAQLFSACEQVALSMLPAHQRPLGFFACWTRKEAYVKARGAGLSLPLADFDVPLAPLPPATRIVQRNVPGGGGDWWLQHVPTGSHYAAAVAAEGNNWRIKQLDWTWSPI